MKTKKRFTLIELLVVIGVIAILMAMLLPAVSKVRVQAKKAKARAQMKALEIAIKSYETTYGLLPWGGAADVVWDDVKTTDEATGESSGSDDDEYDTLMQILTQVNITGSGTDAPDLKTSGNTRQIKFLDAPEKFESKSFVDPWGNRFVVCLDLTYSGVINFNGDADEDDVATGGDLARTVAIYSFGPDKTDNDGSGDDITSWSE